MAKWQIEKFRNRSFCLADPDNKQDPKQQNFKKIVKGFNHIKNYYVSVNDTFYVQLYNKFSKITGTETTNIIKD